MNHRVIRRHKDGTEEQIAITDQFRSPFNKRVIRWAHKVVGSLPLSPDFDYILQYYFISWQDYK